MSREPIIVSKETKSFLERKKQELEEELGEEPSFDDVLRTEIDDLEGWEDVLEAFQEEEEQISRPFFGL